MSKQKQTAVDWLEKQISLDMRHMSPFELVKLFDQAKEMERLQMKEMYVEGGFAIMRHFDGKAFVTSDEYYNETYGIGHE